MNSIKESINDKYLFKCIFIAGGPGAGKSFVVESLADLHNVSTKSVQYFSNKTDIDNKSVLKYGQPVKRVSNENIIVINSDDIFEWMLNKSNVTKKLTFDQEDPLYDIQQGLRNKAIDVTDQRKQFTINGMLPLIIDGTGKNFTKTIKIVESLEKIGYDVTMIFVGVSEETSLARNRGRERSLADDKVLEICRMCNANIEKYKSYFQEDFVYIDNEKDLIYDEHFKNNPKKYPIEPNENNIVASYKDNLYKLGKRIFSSNLKNPVGIEKLEYMRLNGKKYLSD